MILKFATGRFRVRDRTVPLMAKYLIAFLKEKRGFTQADLIPDTVALVLVQEAYRRAAEKTKDGIVRYGEFDKQIEGTADEIVSAYRGESNVDQRIKNILIFNHLL